METGPKQPDAVTPDSGVDHNAVDHAPHGIPGDAAEAEPTGLPNSDRHQVETTPTNP